MENKKKFKRSIRVKVMTMTSIVVVGVMLVCTGILRYSMGSLSESILLDVMQPTAGQSAKAVASDIHLMADRMISLASDNRLTEKDVKQDVITTVLKNARNTYEFYGIGVYDMEGNALAQDGKINDSFTGTFVQSVKRDRQSDHCRSYHHRGICRYTHGNAYQVRRQHHIIPVGNLQVRCTERCAELHSYWKERYGTDHQ